jgi:hypothetical protein
MDDKITIIEGPPPIFESVQDGWALGLNESPYLYELALTRLRTYNGPALVERCHRAWKNQVTMFLEYRNDLGLEKQAAILAARHLDTQDGHVLLLWIRRDPQETQTEFDQGDDDSADGSLD